MPADFKVMEAVINPLLRWTHVVAGIMWIGHLYFFNFVNAQVAKTYDADSKKKVVPELMPRALYWFRWGAAYTWLTGFSLLITLYWHAAKGSLIPLDVDLDPIVGSVVSLVFVLGTFVVYDLLWKSPLAKSESTAAAISYVGIAGAAVGLSLLYGKAIMILVGATFGTIMASNVWMRIWPSQRKIISGIKGIAPAPDASVAALAGLRSKHNTYMSVPLVLFMVAPYHVPLPADVPNWGWGVLAAVIIALGWGVTKLLYNKSGSDAPKFFAVDGATEQKAS